MTQSVTSKVAAILGTVSSSPHRSLTEIARVTGLPLSTVHRLLRELTISGLIERSEHGNYALGSWSGGAGAQVRAAQGIRDIGRPIMYDLAAATRRRVHLGLLENLGVSQGECFGGAKSAFASTVLLPLHASALGKALLAYSPNGVVEAATMNGLARFTHQTIIDPQELRQALADVRRAGIACSWGEFEADSAAAVGVLDSGGTVVAAIAVEVFGLEDIPRLQPSLLLAARMFSRGLNEARHNRPPHQVRMTGLNGASGVVRLPAAARLA